MTRSSVLRPLASSILGITLMLPASFFMLTMLARLCFGSKAMYYYIAPSFLQSPLNLFAPHKAQLIIGCLMLAILFNVLTMFKFYLEKGIRGLEIGVTYRRNWLNTAIVLQSVLLLAVLVLYTCIQHIRY